MVVENEVLPYLQWLWRGDGAAFADGEGAIVRSGIIVLTLFVLALVGGFIVSLVRNGPVKAGEQTYRTLVGGVGDLLRFSPRRVFALAGLANKEALRRRVWVALVVFALVLLASSWFLGGNYREPAPLYISLVTGWASLLVLLTALLTAAFSLPNDIKQKTIYTGPAGSSLPRLIRRPVERRSRAVFSDLLFCPSTRWAISDWTLVLMRLMGDFLRELIGTVAPANLPT